MLFLLSQSQRQLQLSLEAHARYITSLVEQEGLHHKWPQLASWSQLTVQSGTSSGGTGAISASGTAPNQMHSLAEDHDPNSLVETPISEDDGRKKLHHNKYTSLCSEEQGNMTNVFQPEEARAPDFECFIPMDGSEPKEYLDQIKQDEPQATGNQT